MTGKKNTPSWLCDTESQEDEKRKDSESMDIDKDAHEMFKGSPNIVKVKDYIINGDIDMDTKINKETDMGNKVNEDIDMDTKIDGDVDCKKMVVSTDSDEYDTDLDNDVTVKKDSPRLDTPIGIRVYFQACQEWNVKPLPDITEHLTSSSITISNKCTGPRVIYPLCTVLKDNQYVERLNIEDIGITDEGIHHVTEMLIRNDTITHLNIANNSLRLRGAQAIGHVVIVNDVITHLNLSGNKLDDEAIWYLTSGINSNNSITHLDLSYNELGIQSGVLLGSSIASAKTLTWLNLCWNKIYGRGAVAIFRGLMVNTSIEHLDISWNGLGYEGSVSLSKCLKVNIQLRSLNIANNRVDWRCALLLAEGLRSNESLTKLKIGYNPLTTTGVMDILESVATTTSAITVLDCSEIPVLCSADLLAATVSRIRRFRFFHGGIVSTHDKLGERLGRELNPMLKIIEYLRLLGLRPLELMKSFDRTASFELPRHEFVDQIRKIGVKLQPFEIDALANSITGKGYNKNVINYRKLSMAVREVVEAERRRKIKEREEWRQMKNYQADILKRGTEELKNAASSKNPITDPLSSLTSRSSNTVQSGFQSLPQTSLYPSNQTLYKHRDVPRYLCE